jgi:hypothetical protein
MNEINIGQHTCNTVLAKGTAVKESGDDTGVVIACPCGEPDGFLMQAVTSDGPSYMELELLAGSNIDEVITGSKVTIRDGVEGEMDTDQVITTGARAISGASANTKGADELTIFGGKWGKAISGDEICGKLKETAFNGVTGQYRIRRVNMGLKS